MSRLLILFLIALLPLRGWTVERMAVQMQGMPVSVQTENMDAGMSAECAMHMGLDLTTAADPVQAGHGADHAPDHKGCQSCQLCMPLAALESGVSLHLASPPQALPISHSSRFVSAERARDAKPPIS